MPGGAQPEATAQDGGMGSNHRRALATGIAVALGMVAAAACAPQRPKEDPLWRTTPTVTTPAESGEIPTYPPAIKP
jgi:hypothetical protein